MTSLRGLVSHLVMKYGYLIVLVMTNVFRETFACFEGLGPKCRPSLIHKSTAVNQQPIMMSLWFFTLLKICTDMTMKNNYH